MGLEPEWTPNSGKNVQPKYGSGAESGVHPPTMTSGETQMGPEPEWTLNSGQKVQPQYGSGG